MNPIPSFVRFFRFLFVAALALPALSASIAAETFVLVPARGLPTEPAKAALAEALRLVLEKAAPGARFLVLDPVSRETRASFAVPAGTARLRANAAPVREGLVALRRAFLESPARAPWESGALCLPQTVTHIRNQVLVPGVGAIAVFFGDPLHCAPEEAFDWRGGAVPTTGWLLGDADSPFAASRLGSLKGLRVHVSAIPAGWGADDWQRNGVREFLAAMLAEADGKLVTLADAKLALARAAEGVAEALPSPEIDRKDTARLYRRKIFVRGQEQEITVKTATDRSVATGSATEASVTTVGRTTEEIAPPTPPVPVEERSPGFTMLLPAMPSLQRVVPPPTERTTPSPAEIQNLVTRADDVLPSSIGGLGLVWQVVGDDNTVAAAARKADLDVFASVRGVAGECSWQQMKLPKKNPVMWLHEDKRSAMGLNRAGDEPRILEFVEFARGDRDFRPEDLTVWVNMYEHSGTHRIRALFRLQTSDGRKFDHVFELPAVSGNKGAGDRATTPQWQRIDVAKVMAEGLPAPSVATAGAPER